MDYIYYRVYWAYRKKRESAKILSFLYMTMVFAFLFLPVAFSFCELLRTHVVEMMVVYYPFIY